MDERVVGVCQEHQEWVTLPPTADHKHSILPPFVSVFNPRRLLLPPSSFILDTFLVQTNTYASLEMPYPYPLAASSPPLALAR